ncbi:MAG TPA: hypothetical protein VEL76_26085, partial [Gemmataceae bacterium]|nr:hypothetical protein [Gemmataceae bacterium]
MLRSLLPVALLGSAWLLSPVPTQAAKVKVWHHHSPAHHDKAHFKNAVISNEGTLRLARQLKPFANLDATHVWDVVEDKHGNLFVATGDEGKLYKVSPEGKVTVAYTSPDSQILSLALANDGTVYAGTGPSGLIVCIPPGGKTRVLAEDLDSYVWSLAIDEEAKTIYAGTGPKGRIYQVSADGKASVFYSTKQEHILCLAMGPKGMLYAGTDKGGLVYRIDPEGKPFVCYHAPQGEVRSLLVTAEGVVYAGTSAPTRRGGSGGNSSAASEGSSSNVSGNSARGVSEKPEAKEDKEGVIRTAANGNAPKESSSNQEESKGGNTSAPSQPAAGENSLYRIDPKGTVRELFREKAMVLCLMRRHGRVLVGTGMQGQLFEIDEATKERIEIARLDHGQIHCLCRRRDGSIVLGTGDPGKLYVLEEHFAKEGSVVSEVLDAKIISKWGALTWKAQTPPGTSVIVQVRSGNVADPDAGTWSAWSARQSDAESARVTCPPARFLQYKVTLATENANASP